MSIAFPSIFPTPLLGPYQYRKASGVVRTDMETGSQRQRRQFRDTIWDEIPLIWNMNSEELAAWEGWLNHEANGGAEWTDISLFNGVGYVAAQIRFDGSYVVKAKSNSIFEVSIKAEARTMQAYSPSLSSYASKVSLTRPTLLLDRGYGIITGSGGISDWDDQSLIKNNVDQSNGFERPAVNASGPFFDGVDNNMYTSMDAGFIAPLPASKIFTLGIRFKTGTLAAAQSKLFGFNNSADTDVWKMWFGIDAAKDFHFFQADAINGNIDEDISAGPKANDTWYSIILTKTTANAYFTFMIDTASVGINTTNSVTPSSLSTNQLSLGSGVPGGTANCFPAKVAAFVIAPEHMAPASTKALALMSWLNAFT